MDSTNIDTGDQVFGNRRAAGSSDKRRRAAEPIGIDDTEGHVFSDVGDSGLDRRRRSSADSDKRRRAVSEPEGVEDTEGHVAGDQVFDRRRTGPVWNESEDVEDTEGHAVRTYPGVATDDELDCRMPLPGEEDERLRRL